MVGRSLILLTFVANLSCQAQPKLTSIILTYSEDNGSYQDLPSFSAEFRSGGNVRYKCSRGCSVPGEQLYKVPHARFDSLVQAFHHEHFFDKARTDPTHFALDASVRHLAYRDERSIHEVVDVMGRDDAVDKLEKQFTSSIEVDRFKRPSLALYRKLVSAGWNLNTLAEDQQNALFAAVVRRDTDSAKYLLEHGSSITPDTLTYAGSSNAAILRLLIKAAATRLTPAVKTSLLMQSSRAPDVDVLREVLSLGLNPNEYKGESGFTPLMNAVVSGYRQNAALLLDRGADPNASDAFGRRALWYAANATNTGFMASSRFCCITKQR